MIKDIDDLVADYGYGPELSIDVVSTLYMIKRGKHYGIEDSRKVLLRVATDLRSFADDVEKVAGTYGDD